MKIKRLNVINILVLLMCWLFLNIVWNTASGSVMAISQISSIIVLMLLIYHVSVLRVERYKLITFQVIFILLQYIFLFGHVVLYAMGLYEQVSWKLMTRFPAEDIANGIAYAICYVQAIFTGLTWSYKKSHIGFEKRSEQQYSKSKILFTTGIVCFVLFFPFKVYYDSVYIHIASISKGYISSSKIPVNGMIFCFANLSIISFIYIICSKCLKKLSLFCVLGGFVLYLVIVMSQTGDRRYAICGLLSILFCYIYCYNIKITIKNLLFFLLISVITLSFISVLSSIRRESLVSLPELWKLIKINLVEENIIFAVLSEFGVTIFSCVFPIMFYPACYRYKWGMSFVSDIVTILPVGKVFTAFIDTNNVARPINRITNAHVGGSLGGELYGNFGLISIPIAVIFGIILAKLFKKETVEISLQDEKHARKAATYYSLLYICLNLVRAPASEATRAGAYAVLVPMLVMKMLKSKSLQIKSQ